MPQFGKPAAQRQAERARRASNSTFLRNFKEAETMLRWLWEDPARVWVTFYYHFHWAKKISYPCVRNSVNDEGVKIAYCLGCTWPADESLDEEARKKDGDWRVRQSNYGIAAPALTLKNIDGDDREYLDVYQLGVGLHTDLQTLYRENGTVTARDMKIIRTDAEGSKTKYTPVEKGDAVARKYVVELRELLRECAPGMSAEEGTPAYETGWARWRAGNSEVGIPDINAILIRKYAEAAEAYGVTGEEIADRNAEMLERGGGNGVADLKAKAHAAKASAGVAPAPDEAQATISTPEQPAAPVAVEDLPLDELDVSVRTYAMLTRLGISTIGMLTAWPAVTLVENGFEERLLTPLRVALAERGLSLADEPGSADTQPAPAEPAQPEATVTQLPPPAAAPPAGTNGAAAADGEPNFSAWDTPDIRDYLKENKVEFPTLAPRSVLVGLANRHAIGF